MTDDRIVDSNLRLITVNNATTDSAGFEMDRGQRKTDGKVEYRSKADGGGNQTDYARDVLGDSWDFEEDDQEGFTALSNTNIVVSNGIMTVTATSGGSFGGIKYLAFSDLNYVVYDTLQFRMKTDSVVSTTLNFELDDTEVDTTNFQTSTDWETYIFTINNTFDEFNIFKNSVVTEKIYDYEWIQLIGDLDFATHVDGEVEDTWDWEDSAEYWYTEESNISDFDDGTTEMWSSWFGDSAVNDNGQLKIIEGSDNITGARATGLTVTAATYDQFTIEFTPNVTVNTIELLDNILNSVGTDSTGWAADTTHLVSFDLGSDADWTGTETEIYLNITTASNPSEILLNFSFLYDVVLGDLEGFSDLPNDYVNPNGYLSARLEAGAFDTLSSPSSLYIDTSLFTTINIRVKASESLLLYSYGRDSSNNFDKLSNSQIVTTSWQVLTYNLSADSDWSGDTYFQRIQWVWDEADNILDGDELIYIDYFLLLGHWDEADSVIGLYDSNTDAPLLNVTTHFWDQPNDPNYPTSTSELLDSDGDIAYQYLSSNYTTLHDEYVNGKITYDVLRSKVTVEIQDKDFTRLFRVVYPEDYTEVSARIPALFDYQNAPSLFVSTATQATSWQELWIDYITAPFREQDWRQITTPSDPQWLTDTWHSAYITGQTDSGEQSTWRINIPKLDTFSGDLIMVPENATSFDTVDLFWITVTLYAINPSTGTETAFFSIVFVGGTCNVALCSQSPMLWVGTTERTIQLNGSGSADWRPAFSFAANSRNDRNTWDIAGKFTPDTEDNNTNVQVIQATTDLFETEGFRTSEFMLEIDYQVLGSTFDGDGMVLAFDNFQHVSRDIWEGLNAFVEGFVGFFIDPVAGAINSGGNILIAFLNPLFRFLAGVVNTAVSGVLLGFDVIITGLETVINTAIGLVTSAITGMEGVLFAAIGAVETAVGAVTTAVGQVVTAVGSVVTALGSFLEDIWLTVSTFITDLLSDMLTWIEDEFFPTLISFMFTLWDDIWTPILNLVGLKAFVDGIVQQDFTTYVSTFTGMFGAVAKNMKWLVAGLIFFVFTLSFLQAQDSNGRINGFQGLNNMVNNAFKTGITTPDTALLGFSLGRILIPLIIIIYIALKVLIAAGTMPDLFGGLPI
ncbi:MAG: phage tail protein [Candidatus Kariarchaeaceae archaeon]